MKMRLFAACLTGAFVLSGCQTISGITGGDSSPSSAPPPAAASTPSAPAAGGSSAIAGISADRLRDLWGEPTLKRSETGAELWQYAGSGNCTLLVYLYPGPGSAMTVSHAEAVPGGAHEAAVTACAKAAGKPPLKPIS
jgi:hypothetical protein